MTEAQWCVFGNPQSLLDHLNDAGIVTERKRRLLDCACVRRLWHLLLDERGRRAVETAEQYADGLATAAELRAAHARCIAGAEAQLGHLDAYCILTTAATAAWEQRNCDPLKFAAARIAAEGVLGKGPLEWRLRCQRYRTERTVQAALLRDIVGNPFRPLANDAVWFTGTVVALAQTIYAGRAFDRLPILADALEDAGCTKQDILNHCREPGVHVRGCWVVDLILSKDR